MVIKYGKGEAPLTWANVHVRGAFSFMKGCALGMSKASKLFVLALFMVALLSGCSGGAKSTPGVYEPVHEAYDAYDATVLSGMQVNNTLKRFKEELEIVGRFGRVSGRAQLHARYGRGQYAVPASLFLL